MDKTYSDYEGFAYFYNKYWTGAPQELMRRVLELTILSRLPLGSEVLDVCCGTGNTAAFLTSKGYKVTGLDGSAEMLSYALQNAPGACFIQADARDFSFDKKFDACVCLFDSVNHIPDMEGVEKLFKNVGKVLKKKALFLFDVNSLKSAKSASDMDFFAVDENEAFLLKAVFDKKTNETVYKAVYFIKEEGSWKRGDSAVCEKYHEPELLIKALKDAGFADILFADGSGFGIKDFKERLFFTAGYRGGNR